MARARIGVFQSLRATERKRRLYHREDDLNFQSCPLGYVMVPLLMKGLLTLALKNAPQSLPYIDDTLTFSVPSMIT